MDKAFLPPEIIIKILLILPIKTVIRCKCVCKSWLELLEAPEFVKNHLSKSVPGLIVYHDVFNIFEYVDDLEPEHHGFHYNPIIEFDKMAFTSNPPHDAMRIEGSANGLVLLSGYQPNALYVCNPVTRGYIELPCLDPFQKSNLVAYGFGVSLTSGQYKVVRIMHERVLYPETYGELRTNSRSECRVYTLGTGAWRSIAPCPFYNYVGRATRAFCNGNLHWLVIGLDVNDLISYFDLETEVFSTFSPPPPLGKSSLVSDPVVFEDCLCICHNTIQPDNEIVIWVMKEYGNDNSWMKQFVFTKDPYLLSQSLECIYPLKLFEDGDILLLWGPLFLFYYSNKTSTAQKLDLFELHQQRFLQARLHVSSFLSLTSFAMETVSMF